MDTRQKIAMMLRDKATGLPMAMQPPRADAPQGRVVPNTQPRTSEGLAYYLGGTGILERLSAANEVLNPVEGIGQSMRASQRLFDPATDGWGRVAAAGDMASGMAGMVAPMVAASKVGGPAANAVVDGLMGSQFLADESGALKLYHGSPHDFDKFSMDKIGTGEGAQVYGHGLYFAGNEDVARGYRDQLSRPKDMWTAQANGGIEVKYRTRDGREASAGVFDPTQGYVFDQAMSAPFGRMYEVNVDANPEDFINFDAPFSEQPQKVQDYYGYLTRGGRSIDGADLALRVESPIYAREAKEAGIPGIRYLDQGSRATSGGEILGAEKTADGWKAKIRVENRGGAGFQTPTQQLTTSKAFATEAEAMDWARGKVGGGSSNYVVFDDKLISILRKYGLVPGMASASIMGAQDEQY